MAIVKLRVARCLWAWRRALRAALRCCRAFSGRTDAASTLQLALALSAFPAATADAAEVAGADAAAGGCLGGRDAGRVEPHWALLALARLTAGGPPAGAELERWR